MPQERTWEIEDWNPRTRQFERKRVTLAQFRADLDVKKAEALAIYRDNVAKWRAART